MTSETTYRGIGNWDAPFTLTKVAVARQRESERITASVRCTEPPLSWQSYRDGAPCPGCLLPYQDPEPWEFKGTMHMTLNELRVWEGERARFDSLHQSCKTATFHMASSLTLHCVKCCPMPPLSPDVLESLQRERTKPTPDHDLVRWKLRLFCGHVTERRSHKTYRSASDAFGGGTTCDECGLYPATVVDALPLGPVEVKSPKPSGAASRPTRSQLETRVRQLEAEVEALRGRDPGN